MILGKKAITKMQAIVIIAVVVLVVAGGAYYYYLTMVPGKKEIVIGCSLSLSGAYSRSGTYMLHGYQVWEKDVNDRGGLLGLPVRIVCYDDKSDPTTAVSLYEKLITVDKVDAVIGPYSSPIALSTSVITEKYRMPMIEGGGGADEIFERGFKYVFIPVTIASMTSEGFFRMMNTLEPAIRPKKVAMITENTLWPLTVARGAFSYCVKWGYDLIFYERYTAGITDFIPLLTRVKAAEPDVFIHCGYAPSGILCMRQCKMIDFNPKGYFTTIGPSMPEWVQSLGKDGDYVFGNTQWESTLKEAYAPGNKLFVEMFSKMFPGEDLTMYQACGYACCQVFEAAIKAAGTTEPEKLREAIAKLNMTSVLGRVKFDERGINIGRTEYPLLQIQNGKRLVIWPPETQEAKPWWPTPRWAERP